MIALAAVLLALLQTVSLADAAQAFDDAQFHHDRAALEAFLAPDFLLVTDKGAEADRAGFIAASTDPREMLEPFVITQHRIEAVEKTAAWSPAKRSSAARRPARLLFRTSTMRTCSRDGAASGS